MPYDLETDTLFSRRPLPKKCYRLMRVAHKLGVPHEFICKAYGIHKLQLKEVLSTDGFKYPPVNGVHHKHVSPAPPCAVKDPRAELRLAIRMQEQRIAEALIKIPTTEEKRKLGVTL